MTIDQMIDMLQDIKDSRDGDGSGKIRIAEQPDYPFEYRVDGVTTREELYESAGEDDDEKRSHFEDSDVIICAGSQLGYTSKRLWELCRK